MTLLQLIQTIPPDVAASIDEIMEFSSERSRELELGDGSADRDGPDRWDKNKLLSLTISQLNAVLIWLKNNNCRKPTYYYDFTGKMCGL